MSDWLQVSPVSASPMRTGGTSWAVLPIVAPMIHFGALGDRANEQEICDTMGCRVPTLQVEVAVAMPVDRASERPT